MTNTRIFPPLLGYSLIGLLLASCMPSTAARSPESTNLPLQVYCLSFDAAPDLNCTLGRDDIGEMVKRANRYWEQAGIQWDLLPVVERNLDAATFGPITGNEQRAEMKERLIAATPNPGSRDDRVWRVVIMKELPFPAGGLYFAENHTVYFAEKTRRGATKPVVLAHELGHALGLRHTDNPSNLMSIGNPEEKRLLSEEQITAVRTQAAKGPANRAEMLAGPGSDPPPPYQQGRASGPGGGSGQDMEQRRRRMVERFRSFDTNNDGIIHLNDVPEPGQKMFRRIDKNGDERIDASELADFERGAMGARPSTMSGSSMSGGSYERSRGQEGYGRSGGPDGDWRQRMVERFESFDRDGDGVILREDVPDAGHAMFERIDTDGDDRIDALELTEFERSSSPPRH